MSAQSNKLDDLVDALSEEIDSATQTTGDKKSYVIDWDKVSLLGRVPDSVVARLYGCSEPAVCKARKRRDIPAFKMGAPKPVPIELRVSAALKVTYPYLVCDRYGTYLYSSMPVWSMEHKRYELQAGTTEDEDIVFVSTEMLKSEGYHRW